MVTANTQLTANVNPGVSGIPSRRSREGRMGVAGRALAPALLTIDVSELATIHPSRRRLPQVPAANAVSKRIGGELQNGPFSVGHIH